MGVATTRAVVLASVLILVLDAFWAANLDLASNLPELNLYDRDWPVWTYQQQLPQYQRAAGE